MKIPLQCVALLSVFWLGCPSEAPEATPEPTPQPTPDPTPDEEPGDPRGATPWLVVEVQSSNPGQLLDRINRVSGFLRIALYDVEPPFEDPGAIRFLGPINPTIKLLDVDGDGSLDVTADIDVPSLEGGEPLATLLVSSTPVNAGRQLRVGVVAYDFLGHVIGQSLGGERIDFEEPGDEPRFLQVEPIDVDGGPPPCSDGVDNDDDGWIDDADPDCDGGEALEAGFGTTACNDGLDNDGDSLTDADDPDCTDARNLSERPECDDGVDNDGDGWIDDADPDCENGAETGRSGAPCNNGLDDDGDGRVDKLDPDCVSAESSED
jgi:hypothetical protein